MRGSRLRNLLGGYTRDHKADFDGFGIEFDNYYSTHSPENKAFSELIYNRLNEKGRNRQTQRRAGILRKGCDVAAGSLYSRHLPAMQGGGSVW